MRRIHSALSVKPAAARACARPRTARRFCTPTRAAQLARGGSIPQLIRFEKKAGKWNARHMIGGHSVQKVTSFVAGEPEENSPRKGLPVSWTDWTRLFSRK
jgi:hypothetical protein